MELSEELKAVKSENEMLKTILEDANAEKVALDQLFIEALKASLQAKKQLLLEKASNEKLKVEIEVLKQEKKAAEKYEEVPAAEAA